MRGDIWKVMELVGGTYWFEGEVMWLSGVVMDAGEWCAAMTDADLSVQYVPLDEFWQLQEVQEVRYANG